MDTLTVSALPLLDSLLPPDTTAHWVRYFVANTLIYWAGAVALYYVCGTASYLWFFVVHRRHYFPGKHDLPPDHLLRQQVRDEQMLAMSAFPFMALLTAPFNLAAHYGYARYYSSIDEYGLGYWAFSIVLFLLFSDCGIYWIHRALHWGPLYRHVHKPHHRFRYTTTWSSHAFHPVDGWAQSLPYLVFAFLFPFHDVTQLVLYTLINVWTILIHDRSPMSKGGWVNTSVHHDVHHIDFDFNFGQYFTFWDRVGGTYRDPTYVYENKAMPAYYFKKDAVANWQGSHKG